MKKKLIGHLAIIITAALVAAASGGVISFAEDTVTSEENDNLYLICNAEYDRAYDVLDRINAERGKRGLRTLSMDQTLMDAAYIRAAETVLYFEHARPNGMKWNSVNSKVNGENLGRGTGSASEIMRLWMASSGHRENIVRSGFRSVGVACIEHDEVYYWVQLFGNSGSEGAERKEDGRTSIALDLPGEEQGGSFVLDYSITADGEEEEEIKADVGSKVDLGLRSEYLEFDPARIRWDVSAPEVAEIDENGTLNIKSKGRTGITASSGSIERASMEVDARVHLKDVYIMDTFSYTQDVTDRQTVEGNSPKPDFTILSDEGPLMAGRDYTVSYKSAGSTGESTAEIRGIGDYRGIINKGFTVEKAEN